MVGAITFSDKGADAYIWVNGSLGICWLLGVIFALCLYISDKITNKSLLQKSAQDLAEISLKGPNPSSETQE